MAGVEPIKSPSELRAEQAAEEAHRASSSPRMDAFRRGEEVKPVEPGWKHGLVPGKPRGRSWLWQARTVLGGRDRRA
jgi:hypothetical protein